MKYNKSEIMREAWRMFKSFQSSIVPANFSECLRSAWKAAKKAAANKSIEGKKYTEGMEVFASNGSTLSLSRWTKYGKDRLYIGNNAGYYDIQSKKFFWSRFNTSGIHNIAEIESAIRAIVF